MPRRKVPSLLLVLVTMEALAALPLALGAGIPGGDFWYVLPAGLLGVIMSAKGGNHSWRRVAVLTVAAGVSVALGLLAGRPAATSVPVALLAASLYWRGLILGRERPDHEDVERKFAYGLAVFLAGIVLVVARGAIYQRPVWLALAFAGIAYSMTGFAALVMARLDRSPDREESERPAQSIAVAAGLQLGALLVLSLIALEILSLDIAGAIGRAIGPAWNRAADGLALVATAALSPLFWLVAFFHIHATLPPEQARRIPRSHPFFPITPHPGKPEATPIFLGLLLAALVAAALAALIWRSTIGSRREEDEPTAKEERRSLIPAGGLWRFLLAWLRSLFGGGMGLAARSVGDTRRRLFGPIYPNDPIRRVYAQMLYRAANRGLPRPASLTPIEFRDRLTYRWPEGAEGFAAITETYIRRRYGMGDVSESEVRRTREHWHRLRKVMRSAAP